MWAPNICNLKYATNIQLQICGASLRQGLQVTDRGMHRNKKDMWHRNSVCREYDDCLFTLDLRYVTNMLELGAEKLKDPSMPLWKKAGLPEEPRPLKEFSEAILEPTLRAVLQYLET
jgi:hypothetical protein